jgi:hypothetical protein
MNLISIITEELNSFLAEIKEYGNEDIIDAKDINLQAEYDKLNQELFNNELQRVPLKWSNSKRALGRVRALSNRFTGEVKIMLLAISGFYNTPYRVFKNTLAHEMIHVKTLSTGKRDWGGSHGYNFQREADRINGMGLGYAITAVNTEEIAVSDKSKANMKTLIGVIVNIDGKYYLSVTTPNVFNTEFDSVIKLYERLVNSGKYNSVELTAVETKNPQLLSFRIQRSYKRTISYGNLSDELLGQLLEDNIIKEIRIKRGVPTAISEETLPDNSGNWEVIDIV